MKNSTRLCFNSKSPFLTYVVRHMQPQVYRVLLRAFGKDGRIVSMLYRYAVEDVLHGRLALDTCPVLDPYCICQSIILMGRDTACINAIREEGNSVTLRIILELLYRLSRVSYDRALYDNIHDIRSCVCALIECVLVNLTCSTLSDSHVYLLVHSIRALLDKNRIPRPAIIRMQQLEYLLNPHSRFCYYNVLPPSQRSKMYKPNQEMVQETNISGCSNLNATHFKKKLTEALLKKCRELQRPMEYVERDIKAKSRVFEIVSRITERLFGSSPCLFGSGASGLGTVASDMDVVVLQSRELMRRLAFFSRLWKKHGEKDYCPFPCMIRCRKRVVHHKISPKKTDKDIAFGEDTETVPNVFGYLMKRQKCLGHWRWLSRSTREVAAIWSGRILGPRLARFGWTVECVELARVPILRVVAAIDSKGNPKPVLRKTETSNNVPLNPPRNLFSSSVYLDPVLTVSQPKNWGGSIISPFNPKTPKPFWKLSGTERRKINCLLQKRIDKYVEKAINCEKHLWGIDIRGQITENDQTFPRDDIIYVSTDISFNHEVVVHNTRLMKAYAEVEPILVPLSILIKHWAKQRNICDAYQGTLSGYQWMLMVIHYLQHFLIPMQCDKDKQKTVYLPLLPNLQNPPPDLIEPQPQIVDERYDVFFYHPIRGPNRSLFPPSRFTAALSDAPLHHYSRSSPPLHQVAMHDESVSNWPEDLFRNDPYSYALNSLFPVYHYTKKNTEPHLMLYKNPNGARCLSPEQVIRLMCEYSCPLKSNHDFTQSGNNFYQNKSNDKELIHKNEHLAVQRFITQGESSLGTLFQEFFDYFGLRFNSYAYVVSISRTPKLPQKKFHYFTPSPFNSLTTTESTVDSPIDVNFRIHCPIITVPSQPSQDHPPNDKRVSPYMLCNRKQRGTTSPVPDLLTLNSESSFLSDTFLDTLDSSHHSMSTCSVSEDLFFPNDKTFHVKPLTTDKVEPLNLSIWSRPENCRDVFDFTKLGDDSPFLSDEIELLTSKKKCVSSQLNASKRSVSEKDVKFFCGRSVSNELHQGDVSNKALKCLEDNPSVQSSSHELLCQNKKEDFWFSNASSKSFHSSQPLSPASSREVVNYSYESREESDHSQQSELRDLTLDSLCDTDTEQSYGNVSDSTEKRDLRFKRIEKRQKLLAYRVALSRTKRSLRQRPFLCILDPFEKDRTIGPAHRDGFTQLVCEILRVRNILLQAERRFAAKPSAAKLQEVVNAIFAPVSRNREEQSNPINSYDSHYHHLLSSQYANYEKECFSSTWHFQDHVKENPKKLYSAHLQHNGTPLLNLSKANSRTESLRSYKKIQGRQTTTLKSIQPHRRARLRKKKSCSVAQQSANEKTLDSVHPMRKQTTWVTQYQSCARDCPCDQSPWHVEMKKISGVEPKHIYRKH